MVTPASCTATGLRGQQLAGVVTDMTLGWCWSFQNRCSVAFYDRLTLKVYETVLGRALYLVIKSVKVIRTEELASVGDAQAAAEEIVLMC